MALQTKDAGGVIQNLPLYIDPTFSCAEVAITAVTSATDQLQFTGAANYVCRVKHIQHVITPTSTTGTSQVISLLRRSTAATGAGASVVASTTSTTLAKHSLLQALPGGAAAAAPNATLTRFTGTAPTVGTAVGMLRTSYITMNQSGTTAVAPAGPVCWDFGTRGDRPPDVSTATDYLCVNWNAVTQIGTYSYEFEWEEGLT